MAYSSSPVSPLPSFFADGTETQPITFTTILAESALESAELSEADTNDAKGAIKLGKTGKWGGIIVLGKAPTANPANENGVYWKTSIEGLEPENIPAGASGEYGGIDPMDNSGSLTYVRVWHGGSSIGADNEINGITFGGVGSGTPPFMAPELFTGEAPAATAL